MALNFIERKNSKKFTRRELLIGFCVLLVVAIRFIFPARLAGEQFWLSLILFFIFPLLIVRFVLRENLKSFGFSFANLRKEWLWSATAIFLFSLLSYLLVYFPATRNQLSISPDITQSFALFLWYDLFLAGFILFSAEFFFRGFIGFGLEKKIGYWAIPLQAVLYSLVFLKQSWLEILLIFLIASIAGLIAKKSRSIFCSFAFVWISSLVADIILIRFIHQMSQPIL